VGEDTVDDLTISYVVLWWACVWQAITSAGEHIRKDWSCGEAGDKERAVAGGVIRLELAEESPLDRGETSSISSSRSEEQKIDIGIAELMVKNE
jgi:hypothetical protein